MRPKYNSLKLLSHKPTAKTTSDPLPWVFQNDVLFDLKLFVHLDFKENLVMLI